MKPKKYEEVKYEKNRIELKHNNNIIYYQLVAIFMGIFSIIFIILTFKYSLEVDSLKLENQTLVKVIEMKDSMIAELEENCKDLFIENQELKFGGT